MIRATSGKLHWNYFIALEQDLEVASRYVEFSEANFKVYSIEFAHLLFAAASEVDVVAKLACEAVDPGASCSNIEHYRRVLMGASTANFLTQEVLVPRYGLTLQPWSNWLGETRPDWWGAYNKVKHERDIHFHQATLEHCLNALGGLFLITCLHYRYELSQTGVALGALELARFLNPKPTLMTLSIWQQFSELMG